MTTMSSNLNIQSNQITPSENVVSIILTELNRGNVINAVNLFGEDFKFIDHALGLEFNDKERLEVFFCKIRELFPDAHVNVTTIIESGNRVAAEGEIDRMAAMLRQRPGAGQRLGHRGGHGLLPHRQIDQAFDGAGGVFVAYPQVEMAD